MPDIPDWFHNHRVAIPVECVTCFCLDDTREDCLCICHPWNRE